MFTQDRALIHIRFLIARLRVWTATIEGSGSVWNSGNDDDPIHRHLALGYK